MSKKVIIYGILLGMIFCIVGYLSLHQIVGYGMSFLLMLIAFFAGCYFVAVETKNENNGFASFGTLIKAFIPFLLISFFISTISSTIQLGMMDDEAKDEIVQSQLEMQTEMFKSIGLDESKIIEMEDQLEEAIYNSLEPSTFIISSLISIMFFILLSLIPAAIFKKNEPFEVE